MTNMNTRYRLIFRVLRGGSWYSDAGGCRAAIRLNEAPGGRYYIIGFRVVCVPAGTR